MNNMISGTLLAVGYPVLYWILGAVLPDKYQARSIPVMCMTGFLLYYSLLQIIGLPMKLIQQPLSHLTIVWACVMLILVSYAMLRRRKVLADSIQNLFESRDKMLLLAVLAVMTLAVALLLGYNTDTISDYDAAYYIGLPSASSYSNTLELVNALTGKVQKAPDHFYLMNTDTLHSAMIYQALGIHPLIERKWSFTIAMVILFEMVLYQCGKEFFRKEYVRTGVFCVFANLTMFFSYGIANVSHYFAYRTYEGKSIVSYFYMSLIFCFGLALYKKEKGKWPWAGLFLCCVSGISFCNTALFVVPAMAAFSLFPYVLSDGFFRRKWNILLSYVIMLLPGLFWIVLHKVL